MISKEFKMQKRKLAILLGLLPIISLADSA
jgi:hypothetical protein